MSNKELHLTSSGHSDEAADEYAAVVEYNATQPPSYTESLCVEIPQLPATSSSFSDHPLTDNDNCCVSIPQTKDVIQPSPSDNENVQRHDTALLHSTTNLPDNQQQQQQQLKCSPQVETAVRRSNFRRLISTLLRMCRRWCSVRCIIIFLSAGIAMFIVISALLYHFTWVR